MGSAFPLKATEAIKIAEQRMTWLRAVAERFPDAAEEHGLMVADIPLDGAKIDVCIIRGGFTGSDEHQGLTYYVDVAGGRVFSRHRLHVGDVLGTLLRDEAGKEALYRAVGALVEKWEERP